MAIIIGGGPAGMMTAYHLAKKGLYPKVFEEHKSVGDPVQCTGIVTKDILKVAKPSKDVIVNKLKRAKIFSKNNSFNVKLDDMVIDRSKFDKELMNKAQDKGADIYLNQKVRVFGRVGDRFIVETDQKKAMCDFLIGADGPMSNVRKRLNPGQKIKTIVGKQYVVKGDFDPETFEVHLGKIAPRFFGWVVPESDKVARVGIGGIRHTSKLLEKLMKKIGHEKSKVIATQAGIIPIYNPNINTEQDRMYTVGDAAAQVKATTGGGLVQGLIAAKQLAKAISKNESYEKRWKEKLSKELYFHMKARKMLDIFSEKDYDNLISILSHKSSKKVFKRYSRDQGLKLAINLGIRRPQLAMFLPKIMKTLF